MPKNLPIDASSSPERMILDLRKAGFRDVLILGKYHYRQARRQLPAHMHDRMLEICYCSSGEQEYDVGGVLYRIKGGDLFVTYPGEWHGTGGYPEEKGELYWLIIRMDGDPGSSFLGWGGRQAAEWRRRLLALPRHFKGHRNLKRMLDGIFLLSGEGKDVFTQVRVQHLLAGYLLEVIDCSQRLTKTATKARREPKDGAKTRMDAIDRLIRDRMDEPLTLQSLADAAGLSLSRLKSWFREETGSTPLDYVLRYKVRKAQALLREGKLTVAAVGYETGFQSAQYFATVFRKYTGMAPGEYRRRG
jgi:AraC-like DNA-binding protein